MKAAIAGRLLLQARLCGEELDAIAVESSHTIDIDCFVPKSEIDERYVNGPYLPGAGEQGRTGGVRCHPSRTRPAF